MFTPLIAQMGEAMEYFMKGEHAKLGLDFNNAIINYFKAFSLDSNSVIIYTQLADCYKEIGNIKEAEKYLKKSVRLSNFSAENGILLLDLYEQSQDSIVSRELLNNLIKSNSDNIDLLYRKIRYSFYDKDYPKIIDTYKKIYIIDPENNEILTKMIDFSLSLKLEIQLEEIILDLILLFPNKKEPLLALAGMKITAKKFVQGIKYLDSAYQISKDHSLLLKIIEISLSASLDYHTEKYLDIYEKNHEKSSDLIKLKIEYAVKKDQIYQKIPIILLEVHSVML